MQHSDFLPASRPILADLASCERWLERERVADSDRACAAFIGLLDQLEDAPPAPPLCIQILERLRAPMHTALAEQARRYAGKPLPLAPAEAVSFSRSHDLWLAQIRAWRRLLRAGWTKPEQAPDRLRLALRTLESIAGLLTTCFAARTRITPTHWRWLHQAYALAEKENLAELAVCGESGNDSQTCSTIYARVHMLQLANPAALSQREFEWTSRWARRWAKKVRLWHSPGNHGGLAVDLASDGGAKCVTAGASGDGLRFLDCGEVRRSIRGRLKKLAAGSTPEELALGSDCPPVAAAELLNTLLLCWSETPKTREFPRRTTVSNTELIAGFAGIHRTLAGNTFDNEISPWDYTRQQVEQIHVFHKVATALAAQRPDASAERWETLDESANGFRLRRIATGSRLAHRQLVALRPQGASQFILCDIRWMFQSDAEPFAAGVDEGKPGAKQADRDPPRGAHILQIGAKAMPGLPKACAVRPVAVVPANGGAWTQAFVLPLSKGLAPNLVLPIGWYQPGRELELKLQDEQFHVRLDSILERGYDYQRVRFTAIAAA